MTVLFSLALIQLLGSMSPGPDSMLVMKNSLIGSKKSGIYTALGICSALLIHILYINLGLLIFLKRFNNLFFYIKIIGSLYLSYLGFKMIFERNTVNNIKNNFEIKSSFKSFQEGFLCNIFNPKAILFILGIFSLIIKNNSFYHNTIYIIEIIAIPFIWFYFLSLFINIKVIKNKLIKIQKTLLKLTGIVLIFFAIKLLFS